MLVFNIIYALFSFQLTLHEKNFIFKGRSKIPQTAQEIEKEENFEVRNENSKLEYKTLTFYSSLCPS